jgi:catechol 2,3-dioxygenase-like lactoylglutathione lyase family enzyme
MVSARIFLLIIEGAHMLHHISFAVADLNRAIVFYDAILQALGYARVWTNDTAVGYGIPGRGDQFAIKFRSSRVPVPGPGFHLAFTAPARRAVDAFHRAALSLGARDVGAPGLRLQYGPHYYAAFVVDPDGYHLEAVIDV